MVVGLTGGIGSGKSTVAAGLRARGAAVVDADTVARLVVEPGGEAYDAVVERFGPAVVRADGRLDRAALAARVFGNPAALADLNRLTHPAIAARILAALGDLRARAEVVVLDIPLLDERSVQRYGLAAVVVVDVPEDVAVARLVAERGFTEADARARIAAQAGREARLALADWVIDNSGTREALEADIERLWRWLEAGAPARR